MKVWRFDQINGPFRGEIRYGDTITCMKFNQTGDLLCVGDKEGRITVYIWEKSRLWNKISENFRLWSALHFCNVPFSPYVGILENPGIVAMEWMRAKTLSDQILFANSRIINLVQLANGDRSFKFRSPFDVDYEDSPLDLSTTSIIKSSFASRHRLPINSMSLTSNGEFYITSDPFGIVLESLDKKGWAYLQKNVWKSHRQELINTTFFNSRYTTMYGYCTNKGTTRICDIRTSGSQVTFDSYTSAQMLDTYYTNIFDGKFSWCGESVITRELFSVKIWDIRSPAIPIESHPINNININSLMIPNVPQSKLFNASLSYRDKFIAVGSYDNSLRILDRLSHLMYVFDLKRNTPFNTVYFNNQISSMFYKQCSRSAELDYNITCVESHPTEYMLAIAANNYLTVLKNYQKNFPTQT